MSKAGINGANKNSSKRTMAYDRSNIPSWLIRTSIYKRVPASVRQELDEAILCRPDGCDSLEAIVDKFQLSQRYSISLPVLRTYARKLEGFARPAMTSQLIAGVLGCLPDSYRQQVVSGSEALLLSKVVQALAIEEESALTVAELARLASVLSAVAVRSNMGRDGAGRSRAGKKGESADADADSAHPNKMAEAVRMLYGLPWPPKNPN